MRIFWDSQRVLLVKLRIIHGLVRILNRVGYSLHIRLTINELTEVHRVQVRLSFQLAHQNGDETEVMEHHKGLRDIAEDQLCLAAIHYLRSNYQDAIDIYKGLVLQNKDIVALHVYIALCYYKLDFYDVSQEVLSVYLQKNPDSLIAINLKACNIYRLYNGRAAETEIRALMVRRFKLFLSLLFNSERMLSSQRILCLTALLGGSSSSITWSFSATVKVLSKCCPNWWTSFPKLN